MKGDKIKVAICIDGVLRDWLEPVIKYVNKKYGTSWEADDVHTLRFRKSGVSLQQEKYEAYKNKKIIDSMKPINGATKALSNLYKRCTTILVSGEPFHSVVYTSAATSSYKAKGYSFTTNREMLGVDVIVEHDPFIASKCADNGIFVILFDKTYNQSENYYELESHENEGNVVRVSSWYDASKEIRRYMK